MPWFFRLIYTFNKNLAKGKYSPEFATLGGLLAALVTLGIGIWLWGSFLDASEHDHHRVRRVLLSSVVLLIALELCLALSGAMAAGPAGLLLLATICGVLDAALRFPASHVLRSAFMVKQAALVVVKTVCWFTGLLSQYSYIGVLMVPFVLDVFAPSLLYFMALPLDVEEQVPLQPGDDVDIVFRTWQLLVSPTERKRCFLGCQRAVRAGGVKKVRRNV
eukprot:NODE_15518_length_1046_cov_3.946681.p1 GENE.NODE_15518_length_1046_cov_3.946681~~NODE_15518_length_1046_cov_3.946681.p1  ORF type:complete len:219 (+),score=70.77 NODE_15518_length_1046_cov_3.946681:145-801(+)